MQQCYSAGENELPPRCMAKGAFVASMPHQTGPQGGNVLPSPHPDVVYKPVSEGAVLLHTRSEVYFGLNEVGRQVWDLLPPACTDLARLCDELASKHPDIARAQLEADVTELLQALSEEGLLVENG